MAETWEKITELLEALAAAEVIADDLSAEDGFQSLDDVVQELSDLAEKVMRLRDDLGY